MGKVIIKFKDNHLESFKCKSEQRASEIFGKRNKAVEYQYYEKNERIPPPKKKLVAVKKELTLEQMEYLLSRL